MDLVSHALAGAAAGGAAGARFGALRRGALIGATSALAVDLDYFIHSSEDPLFQIEMHRHFSHSLIFIPIGGLIMSLLWLPLLGQRMRWRWIWLCATAGYGTHWALDVLTGYGVHLFWPFTDQRVALDLVSVVDPVLTLVAGTPVLIGLWQRRSGWFLIAALLALSYAGLGWIQQQRSLALLQAHAETRGHAPEAMRARPSFGNLLVWRGLYRDGDHWHVAALRPTLLGPARVYARSASSIPVFDQAQMLPEVPTGSRIDRDIARLDTLSEGYLVWIPEQRQLGDIRFAVVPDSLQPMWGLRFHPEQPEQTPEWFIERELTPDTRTRFLDQLLGHQEDADQWARARAD